MLESSGSPKPSLLLISHTYVVGEHAKKLPELARHFDLTCVTTSAEDFGPMYGLEGGRFETGVAHEGYTVMTLPALGSVRGVTRFFMRGLSALIRSQSWDYVLVENEPWSFLKWQTVLACKLSGCVRHCGEFTWENVRRPGMKGLVLSFVYKATAWWSDFVIAGNRAAAALLTDYGMPADRVWICPQVGVDEMHYHPVDETTRTSLRARWSLPREAFLVGFAGRLVPEKGVADVAAAIASLPAACRGGAKGVHFAAIGHGPLKVELLERDPEGQWLQVRDAVPHHELPSFLQCLDVLFLGSHPMMKNGECWEEQFGHILIEAAACGALAVGSTSGAIPEVLDDAELTFPPGDVAAIQRLIERLVSDRDFLEEKKEKQRARLLKHYTHAAVADRCAQFLLSLSARDRKISSGTQRLTCIVIPVHNRRALTLRCLDGLRWCAADAEWKIILVDDGSTDGTGEAVRATHPHVEIVQGNGELYWTGAMRLGMARGLEFGCTEFVWLNDDTLPEEASVRRIAGLVRSDPQRVIASTALLDGVPQACCGLNRRGLKPLRGTLLGADVLAGYQVAFSATLVDSIGLPNARCWPHYGGDSSFTHTAHHAGYRLAVDGDSFIVLSDLPPHRDVALAFWKGHESLGARIRRVFFATRSRYRLLSLWHLDRLYRGTAAALLVFPARLGVMTWKILRHPRTKTVAATPSEIAA